MTEKNEWEQQAEDFLKDTETIFHVEYLRTTDEFIEPKGKYQNDVYRITLSRGNRSYSFEFTQSAHNSGRWFHEDGTKTYKKSCKHRLNRKNKDFSEPTPYDVFSSLTKYDPGSFEDFCSDYGYDEDSRKAEKIYLAVLDEWRDLKMLYSNAELAVMGDIQ